VSALFGATLREAPADSGSDGSALLYRAGYVRQLASGVFSLLPLGHRACAKIEDVLRDEMDAIGGQELTMPVVHPAELWQRTGRYDAIDESLVRFQDRRERPLVLGMTHEEVVALLTSSEVLSYKELPKLVYQIQTKFRDEARPRNGLVRAREFTMKDSYSLDLDQDGLAEQYDSHLSAYHRIFARVDLPVVTVSSDVGLMGGSAADEFMYLSPMGEDTLALCDNCGYSSNAEVAGFRKTTAGQSAVRPMERVHTPGTTTIADLQRLLDVPAQALAKTMLFVGEEAEGGDRLVLAVVRGDHEVNHTALANASRLKRLRPAREEEITAAGAVAGYASPVGLRGVLVVVDTLLGEDASFVMGANEGDYHLAGVVRGRDYTADVVTDLAEVYEGAACERCGSPLRLARGVEVGNIFQLGTRYTEALGALYVDEAGDRHPVVMGSYGIGVGRLLACLAEEHRDDRGLALPPSVAPFDVALVSLGRDDEARAAAERLYADLRAAGVSVLFDDRDVSAGVKFADADLRGLPVRVTVSPKSLKAGGAEVKSRTLEDTEVIGLDQVAKEADRRLRDLTPRAPSD
jgi:prolyl-tRNA synthetase